MRKGRGRSRRDDRRTARGMTVLVIMLQASVIGAFIADPGTPPKRGALWQALWGLFHVESFIPLIAMVVVAPPLTWLAWTVRGGHRWWLALAWGAFGGVAGAWFAHRIWVMLRLTYEYGV